MAFIRPTPLLTRASQRAAARDLPGARSGEAEKHNDSTIDALAVRLAREAPRANVGHPDLNRPQSTAAQPLPMLTPPASAPPATTPRR